MSSEGLQQRHNAGTLSEVKQKVPEDPFRVPTGSILVPIGSLGGAPQPAKAINTTRHKTHETQAPTSLDFKNLMTPSLKLRDPRLKFAAPNLELGIS